MSGYTRQQSYIDGDTILAEHTNDEFDLLAEVFSTSLGHKHDGTVAEGPTIDLLSDDDGDTKIQVEEGLDDDTIRFDTLGVERLTIGSTGDITATGNAIFNGTVHINSTITVDGATTFSTRPAFNGGTTGVDSPFTVDSTFKVTNLNADLFDDLNSTQFLRSDVADQVDGVLTYTAIPAFNGGTSGVSAPFTVDSTFKVTNLNADLLDGLDSGQFVRSDTSDTITGTLHFNTSNNVNPLSIGRTASTTSEIFAIGIDDTNVQCIATNDEALTNILFTVNATDTESGGGASANTSTFTMHTDISNGFLGVVGPTGGNAQLRVQTNNLTGTSSVYFGDTASASIGNIGYNHTSDYMQFTTNGSERVRISSGGQVGIGTTITGSTILQIVKPESFGLRIANSAGLSSSSTISLDPGNNGEGVRDSQIRATNDGLNQTTLEFYTSDAAAPAERMRITNTGNVGIGTTSPGQALDVVGSINITNNSFYKAKDTLGISRNVIGINSSDNTVIGTNSTSTRFVIEGGAAGTAATIKSSGLLQIGTTSSLGSTTLVTSDALSIVRNTDDWLLRHSRTDNSQICGIQSFGHSGNVGLSFYTNSSERMRILQTGEVVIGDTAADSIFHVNSGTANIGITVESTDAGAQIQFKDNTTSSEVSLGALSNDLRFITSASERSRIDSAGRFFIGTTNSSLFDAATGDGLLYVPTSGVLTVARDDHGTNQSTFISNKTSYVSGTTYHIIFRENGTTRGSITSNGSTTAYNTTSDYRLKENVVDLTDATSRLKELPVHRFNFIGQEQTVDGFIAHEVQAVVPEAVTGEKDGEETDGTPIMQQMDASKLVPLLTAALKETTEKLENVVGRLEELEVRIQELEGK